MSHVNALTNYFAFFSICIGACGTPVVLAESERKPIEQLISDAEMDIWENYAFEIEDSKTRVGIASVKLSVSKLVPVDGELVGRYEIIVPLMESKNDRGRIVLPIDLTVAELGKTGGVLKGKAYSEQDKTKINLIVCEISSLKKKEIRLAITTSERTLHFDSNYTMFQPEG